MADTRAVLCVGALHYDRITRCERPIRKYTSNPVQSQRTPGGVAHNIARNLRLLDRRVGLCSLIGTDGGGLIRHLSDCGIDVGLIEQSDEMPSADYTAVLEPSGDLAFGLADMAIYDHMDKCFLGRRLADMLNWPVWLIDANLPESALRYLTSIKSDQVICAAPVSVRKSERWKGCMDGVDLWVGNEQEVGAMTGMVADTPTKVIAAAEALYGMGPSVVVASLGEQGAILKTELVSGHWSAAASEIINVNGAGDALYAGFLDAYLSGESPESAIEQALAIASLTVETSASVRRGFDREMVVSRRCEIKRVQTP